MELELYKQYDMERLVIVTTGSGEKLLGELETIADMSKGRINLHKVRKIMLATDTRSKTTGEIVSLQVAAIILPVDINNGPIEGMMVAVDSLYRVVEQPGLETKIDALLRREIDNEIRLRAESSGIVTR
jgi:hypothetical protein